MWVPFQLSRSRIVAIKGHENDPFVVTSTADIARVIRLAIKYEKERPEIGGFSGNRLSPRQLKKLAQKVQGRAIKLELVHESDLAAGVLRVDMPQIVHASIPEEQRLAWHVPVWIGLLSAISMGAWDVSDEWKERLPDYKFLTVEEYLKAL
ncbi:hypothetical protein DL768_001463 [Monosporascus sp. mg162]|nr:hypothetical protein DL768_001463 [Monosporascus sp. mg162]